MENKRIVLFVAALCMTVMAVAARHEVKRFSYYGPVKLQRPVMVTDKDVKGKPFSDASLLDVSVDLQKTAGATAITASQLPAAGNGAEISVVAFRLSSTTDTKVSISLSGLQNYRLYLDGRQISADNKTALSAGSHQVSIKYLTLSQKDNARKLKLSYDADDDSAVSLMTDGSHRQLTLHDIIEGKRISTARISPSGRYLIAAYYDVKNGGKTTWSYRLIDLSGNRTISETAQNISWMPGEDTYYYIDTNTDGKRRITTVDAATGARGTLAEGFPEGSVTIAPNHKWLLISKDDEIERKNKDVMEIREPDDRQSYWRSRTNLIRYDIATGVAQPLTFGSALLGAQDISADSRYVLYSVSHSRLTARPTTLTSLYLLDTETMQTKKLVDDDGFIGTAALSPDGKSVAIQGSPEAFGGIGKNLPDGRTPSMYDYQLYLLDIASLKVRPLTRNFNPSIESFAWSEADGKIYTTALDRDYIHFYRINPATDEINELPIPEDVMTRFTLAEQAPRVAWIGESATNTYRLYTMDATTGKSSMLEDQNKELLDGVDLATCEAWNFSSVRGDTISARFYLPAGFDKTKKYPMIVNYYGGCSPTSRYFESRYPHCLYAAMGYVVLLINPSGAAGFGQEYASRHVNTAGDMVADDIIEGTKQFAATHSFVDAKKIGCIGASYGGFMTQYLQTVTDIFAAAVSHAGISDHTSYWGGGYWGYSYSEVSMAGKYPWTDRDLYVGHSPIYNVDKIHTPILFVHGTSDHNVPPLESRQMFTALKLLGRETALIEVKGEDHWIMDYQKRFGWQNAIFAWFQKYLKGDSSWWDNGDWK